MLISHLALKENAQWNHASDTDTKHLFTAATYQLLLPDNPVTLFYQYRSQTLIRLNQMRHSTLAISGCNVPLLAFIPWLKKKTTWSSKFRLCFPALLAPLSPLVLHYFFFPPCPFLLFLFIHFEASPEDSVNGLTSQLLLKQCGLGPLLCSVCIEERARPRKVNRGPWHSGGRVR